MQIIEHSVIGTRSAVIRLRRLNTPLQFLVFPMIHVAAPQFYASVAKRLRTCDLLVVEGVRGSSVLGSALTLTYRIIPARKDSGLVSDNIDYGALGVPLINPDVTTADLARGFRAMPLRFRLVTWIALPLVAVMQFFGGPRRLLSPEVEVSDLPSASDEELADNEYAEQFEELLTGDRDTRLLAALAEIVRDRAPEPITVGVVYGAAHVPAIVEGLHRIGYRPQSGEWLTVLAG